MLTDVCHRKRGIPTSRTVTQSTPHSNSTSNLAMEIPNSRLRVRDKHKGRDSMIHRIRSGIVFLWVLIRRGGEASCSARDKRYKLRVIEPLVVVQQSRAIGGYG